MRVIEQVRNMVSGSIDNQVKAYSSQMADAASKFVAKKIKDFLYLDQDRYAVDMDGNKLNIYQNKSTIIDKLFKEVSGSSLTEYLNNLPVGLKQFSGYLRNKFEMMTIELLVQEISKVSVGKTVEMALLSSYGYTKEVVEGYVAQNYNTAKNSKSNASINQLLTQFKEMLEKQDKAEVEPTLTEQGKVTLDKVFNHYKYKIQRRINTVIQDSLVYGLEQAGSELAEATAALSISRVANAAALAGGGSAVCTGNVVLFAAGYVINLGLKDVQGTWAKAAGDAAAKKLKSTVTPSIKQRDYISVDMEASGDYAVLTQKYSDNQGEIGEWEEVNYKAPTLCTWMYDKAEKNVRSLTEYFNAIFQNSRNNASQMHSQMSPVAKSWGGWTRDNDYNKLVGVREAYVHYERTLYALELEAMEAVEYARGQREDLSEEGLTRWDVRLKEIQAQMTVAKEELDNRVATISVENAYRKLQIINEGEKLVSNSIKTIAGELEKFDIAKVEAREELKHVTLRKRFS